jgi:signal transduction histidine kinase
LRLRAEFVDDEEQRRKMLVDLDDMEKMVFSALSFARADATQEPRATVDFRTLLQRVCDDTDDAGYQVTFEPCEDAVPYDCRPVAMRRALTNLIDNAVKYGHRAHVSLTESQNSILVTIDDDGPGIPDDRLEDVFKPFRRLEQSRSRETGGTGLGMTVARSIVRAHGGDIGLTNRSTGGLRVEIQLPK